MLCTLPGLAVNPVTSVFIRATQRKGHVIDSEIGVVQSEAK